MFRHCEAFLIPHGGIATVVLLRDSVSAPLCFEAPAEAVWSLDLGPFIILRIRICILGTALYSVSAFRIRIRIRFRGSRAPAQAAHSGGLLTCVVHLATKTLSARAAG